MDKERYIAALEISSSKIVGTVGRIDDKGQLDVLAVEQEKGVEWVRHGIIQNLEETGIRISRIIEKLERRAVIAPRRINSVFIGLSGRSLHSIKAEVKISLPEETEINEEIIKRLEQDVWRTEIDSSLEIVDAVPRYYVIGKQATHSPIGVLGNEISAVYDVIVCRPEMKKNIDRTVREKLHIDTCGYVVTALSAGQLILSNDEKRLGCMLVDLGAETTTVTIYKNGNLIYFDTIPLGSRNITRDLTSLNVLEEAAEEIKMTSGNAIAADKPSTLSLGGLRLADVNDIIAARSEEIVANIIEQIEYAGLKQTDLPGGIIGIGGGFKMNGMTDLIARESGLPVRRGRLPQYVRLDDIKSPSSETIEAVSILYAGATHSDVECLEEPERDELPTMGDPNEEYIIEDEEELPVNRPSRHTQRGGGFFGKIGKFVGGIFGDNGDDDTELI
ncbi:MAG: cell division protein FtsA [Muribaculaceae bacterium]|nr:cell division protein FtsA [Muribaculaceae bacterium]